MRGALYEIDLLMTRKHRGETTTVETEFVKCHVMKVSILRFWLCFGFRGNRHFFSGRGSREANANIGSLAVLKFLCGVDHNPNFVCLWHCTVVNDREELGTYSIDENSIHIPSSVNSKWVLNTPMFCSVIRSTIVIVSKWSVVLSVLTGEQSLP